MKNRPLFVAIILLLLILTACEEAPRTANHSAPQPAQSQTQTPQPEQPQPEGWPFLSGESNDSMLAKDLTTRNFVLIFDGSGSMSESECSENSLKIDVAKRAVVAWSKSVPATANLALYSFNAQGIVSLPLETGDRDTFMQTIMGIRAGGKTPLTDALLNAYKTLTDQGKRQLGYGEYAIVVVTDGIADSSYRLKQAVDTILKQSPVTIFSIGFCIGDHHSLNQPGRTLYRSADNPEELRRGLQEVLAESEAFDEQDFSN